MSESINCREQQPECSETVLWLINNKYQDNENLIKNVYNHFLMNKTHNFLKQLEIHNPDVFSELVK